jgi:hypothetical protein
MCAPGLSVDEYFSTGPDFERPIFEAVMQHLDTVGPVHVEPVQVGIFLKRAMGFAQLRPMTKWVALSFGLDRRERHRTITRKVVEYHGRYHHVANIVSPPDIDDDIKSWLTEAYFQSPPA